MSRDDFKVAMAREYLLDHNKTQAYIRAGGKAKDPANVASTLFRHKRMQVLVAREEAKAVEKFNARQDEAWLTKLFVLNGLKENYERAMTAVPVLDRKGEPTGEWQYEGNVANKALELMGKEIGMFQERENKGGDTFNFNGPNPFSGLIYEEIAAWREERRAKKMLEGKVVNTDAA